jgi:hypothetical protein
MYLVTVLNSANQLWQITLTATSKRHALAQGKQRVLAESQYRIVRSSVHVLGI